jgi:serine/threonine protein kinase
VAEKIAETTMLLTFAARDRRDTRTVDLHVISPRLASLAPADRVLEALERMAALHDPRIVPVRDCGMTQGIIFFATAPLEGRWLRDRLIRDRHLPLDAARSIATDLLDVLVYAHGHDVRHGDLRPSTSSSAARGYRLPRSGWSRRSISRPRAARREAPP